MWSFRKSDMPVFLGITPVMCVGIFQWQCCLKRACRGMLWGGQGPSAWACLTSAARSSKADGPSPRNPTTTGSNRDSSGSSASLKARNSLQGQTPIKSLCSPVSATSQALINAPVWGFKRNKTPCGCFLLVLEWECAELSLLKQSWVIVFSHLSFPYIIIIVIVFLIVVLVLPCQFLLFSTQWDLGKQPTIIFIINKSTFALN